MSVGATMQLKERLERVKKGYPRVVGMEDRMASALLAVLELHKPMVLGITSRGCDHCSEDTLVEYPCHTVRAIEQAMGEGDK